MVAKHRRQHETGAVVAVTVMVVMVEVIMKSQILQMV